MSQLAITSVPEQMNTLLMPVAGQILLLPHANIAEVGHFQSLSSGGDGPDWFLGFSAWRGVSVPTLSYESLVEGTPFRLQQNSRMLYINGLTDPRMPFWALPILGLPKMLKLRASQVSVLNSACKPGEKQLLDTEYGPAMLPDLDYLEQQLLSLL